MAKSYLKDQKRILPCAAYLSGEYGRNDMYVGVPCMIGGEGVEKVIEFPMDAAENEMMEKSIGAVNTLIEACKNLEPSLA